MKFEIEWQGLGANIYYDEQGDVAGWYAEYYDDQGIFSDSEKVWEGGKMPTRRNALRKAMKIAMRALKAEARRRAEG